MRSVTQTTWFVSHLSSCYIISEEVIIFSYYWRLQHNRIYHNNLEEQRKMLIDSLIEYRKIKGHDITSSLTDGRRRGEGASIVYRRIKSSIRDRWEGWFRYQAYNIIWQAWVDCRNFWQGYCESAWTSGSVPYHQKTFLICGKKDTIFSDEEEHDNEYGMSQEKEIREKRQKRKAVRRALSKL